MKRRAREIIESAVDHQPTALLEATVRRPPRSSVYVATFTAAHGGQITRSTGQRGFDAAMELAKRWEAAARREREAAKSAGGVTPITGQLSLGLTQREVAMLMDLSERAVRSIERRAIRKLSRHPLVKAIWREYSESTTWPEEPLTPQEVEALLSLATTWSERRVLWKVLSLIGQPPMQGGQERSERKTGPHHYDPARLYLEDDRGVPACGGSHHGVSVRRTLAGGRGNRR
jgi:hypothetical protein